MGTAAKVRGKRAAPSTAGYQGAGALALPKTPCRAAAATVAWLCRRQTSICRSSVQAPLFNSPALSSPDRLQEQRQLNASFQAAKSGLEAEQARQDALLREGQALTVLLSYQAELTLTVEAQAQGVPHSAEVQSLNAAAALPSRSNLSSAAAQQQQQVDPHGWQPVDSQDLHASTRGAAAAAVATSIAATARLPPPGEPPLCPGSGSPTPAAGSVDAAIDALEQQLSFLRWSEPELEVADKAALQLQLRDNLNPAAGLSEEPSSSASGVAQSSLQSSGGRGGALRQILESAQKLWRAEDWKPPLSQMRWVGGARAVVERVGGSQTAPYACECQSNRDSLCRDALSSAQVHRPVHALVPHAPPQQQLPEEAAAQPGPGGWRGA